LIALAVAAASPLRAVTSNKLAALKFSLAADLNPSKSVQMAGAASDGGPSLPLGNFVGIISAQFFYLIGKREDGFKIIAF